jgi:hypothetical protein
VRRVHERPFDRGIIEAADDERADDGEDGLAAPARGRTLAEPAPQFVWKPLAGGVSTRTPRGRNGRGYACAADQFEQPARERARRPLANPVVEVAVWVAGAAWSWIPFNVIFWLLTLVTLVAGPRRIAVTSPISAQSTSSTFSHSSAVTGRWHRTILPWEALGTSSMWGRVPSIWTSLAPTSDGRSVVTLCTLCASQRGVGR